jgi:hypothetical protein
LNFSLEVTSFLRDLHLPQRREIPMLPRNGAVIDEYSVMCLSRNNSTRLCIGVFKSFKSVCSGGFNTCQFFLICETILLRVRKTAVTMKYSIEVLQQVNKNS